MYEEAYKKARALVEMSLYAPNDASTPRLCQQINDACHAINMTQVEVGAQIAWDREQRLKERNSHLYALMAGGWL
jgi:hypothetical protein